MALPLIDHQATTNISGAKKLLSDTGPKDRVGLPNVPSAESGDEDHPVTMGADDFVELQPTDPSTHVDTVDDFVPSVETMFEAVPARVALVRAHRRWRVIVIAGIVFVTVAGAGAVFWLLHRY